MTELRASDLETAALSGLDAFVDQSEAWSRLVRDAGIDPLCNGPAWVASYVRSFAKPGSVFGWSFRHAGEVVGLVALRREDARGALGVRRAMLAQDGSFDSDYLDLAVRPDARAAVLERLIEVLGSARGVHALLLSCVPDESPTLELVRAELGRRSLPRKEVAVGCAALDLPDDFEAYVGGLKKRMRSKVRSLVRNAEAAGGELRWCDRADELDAHLERMFALHQARWQAADEPGSFDDPRRCAFFRSLAHTLLTRDELRFARLEIGGEAVAYQYGAQVGGTYYQLQEGYDPAHEELRVGNALRALMLRDLIASGTRRYDFLAGLSKHKTDWGGVERSCTSVAFALPGVRARIAYGLRAWLANRDAS